MCDKAGVNLKTLQKNGGKVYIQGVLQGYSIRKGGSKRNVTERCYTYKQMANTRNTRRVNGSTWYGIGWPASCNEGWRARYDIAVEYKKVEAPVTINYYQSYEGKWKLVLSVTNSDDGKIEKKLSGVTNLCSRLLDVEPKENRKSGRSGLKQGSLFHRHMFHDMVCQKSPSVGGETQPRKETRIQSSVLGKRKSSSAKTPLPKKRKVNCQCYQKFGSKTRTLSNPESKLSKWLGCAKTTLSQLGLKHVASELCLKSGSHATEMDLLCMDRDGSLVNVSWKTGYNKHVVKAHELISQTRDVEVMLAGNENLKMATCHRLQQLCENRLFRTSFKGELEINSNLIVYIGCTSNPSKCMYVFHSESSNRYLSTLLEPIEW